MSLTQVQAPNTGRNLPENAAGKKSVTLTSFSPVSDYISCQSGSKWVRARAPANQWR